MTLKEAIHKAADGNATAAALVADVLRFKYCMTYQQSLEVVRKVRPEVTLPQWDALLREADELV